MARHTVLDEKQIYEIIQRHRSGDSIVEITKDFDTSPSIIRKIIADTNVKEQKQRHKDNTRQMVESDDISQTYRQNLAWAMEAVGHFLRTGEAPGVCPNDAAFFLYKQATDEPKDFLTKINQVEAKVDDKQGSLKQATTRSIEEIDIMLATLEENERKTDKTPLMV